MTSDLLNERNMWSPWIDHDGKGCPASLIGLQVHCIAQSPDAMPHDIHFPPVDALVADCLERHGAQYNWRGGVIYRWRGYAMPQTWIHRYRIRRTRSFFVLNDLLRGMPVKVDV